MKYPSVRLFKWTLSVPNLKEYHSLRREIFSTHQYYLEINSVNPLIIDAGAHIGLSCLYFKRLFPQCSIVALEPHPGAFSVLKDNLASNGLDRVLPLNLALWPYKQTLSFYTDPSSNAWWSNTSALVDAKIRPDNTLEFTAQTVTLQALYDGLGKKIDLLKLDVEGAEWPVLFTHFGHFDFIDHYLVEYHPARGHHLLEFCSQFPKDFQVTCYKNGRELNPKTRQGGLVIVHAARLSL
jgi:FkbM family methyltransferase